ARRGAEAELARLQAELARLTEANQSLLAEREQFRSAERAAAGGQAEEVTSPRRRRRATQAGLRAVSRSAEQAAAELDRLRAERDAQRATDAAELRRVRARLADLEAELEVNRRAVRAAR